MNFLRVMQINSRLESIEPEIRTGVLPLSGAVEQVNEHNFQKNIYNSRPISSLTNFGNNFFKQFSSFSKKKNKIRPECFHTMSRETRDFFRCSAGRKFKIVQDKKRNLIVQRLQFSSSARCALTRKFSSLSVLWASDQTWRWRSSRWPS